jgi:hypothetical protein
MHVSLTTHMELTFSAGPCTWPVTVPLLVFFTQPTTPIFFASSSVYWFQEKTAEKTASKVRTHATLIPAFQSAC